MELNVFYLAIEDCNFVKSFAFPQIAFKQVESVHVWQIYISLDNK